MAMSGGKDDGSPMMEMNTTPLIDVMLVLLIMFIITIPVATHSVDIDLPPPSDNPPPPVLPIRNKLVITADGTLAWNTGVIDGGQLVTLLQQTRDMKPEPELQFQPDADASYDLSSKVINIIKGSKVTKFGFVGNEQYSEFNKSPNAPKTP